LSSDVPLPWKIKWLEGRVSNLRSCFEANRESAKLGRTTEAAVRASEGELRTAEAVLADYLVKADAEQIEDGLQGRRRAS
jgi:hypothetical protein